MDWLNGNKIIKNTSQCPSFRDYRKGVKYTSTRPGGQTGRVQYFRQNEASAAAWNNMEAHSGSTLVSHIAYKMYKSRMSVDLSEQIWFKSMDYLKSSNRYKTLKGFRNALKNAAEIVINNGNYHSNEIDKKRALVSVHSALNYTQVFSYSGYKMGDINRDNKVDSLDAQLVRRYVSTPSLYTSDSRTPEIISLGDVDYDGFITNTDADKILQAYANRTPLN